MITSRIVSPSSLGKSSKLSGNTLPSKFESIARYAKTSTPLKEEEKNATFVVSHESENALNNTENWRREGKTDVNKKRKKKFDDGKNRKKFNYLDACADWDFLPNGPVGISLDF